MFSFHKEREFKSPNGLFRNERGAIDLASIMVGIIVIGLVGGVIAATVFAIIPWTQDKAAKQQLDSIVAAQSSYMGLSSAVPAAVPSGHPANSYADSKQLESARLLTEGENYCTTSTEEGKGFLAITLSGSGKYWVATDDKTQPKEISPLDVPEDCGFPYVDKNPTLTAMTYNCPTTREVQVPIWGIEKGKGTWSDGTVTDSTLYSPNPKTLVGGVEYKFTFEGTYTSFGLGNYHSGADCLISLDHWGSETGVTDASDAFFGSRSLIDVPSHIPSTITDMDSMFRATSLFNDPDVNNWDVSNVTNMNSMFLYADAFNSPLNSWDVSKVENMGFMFAQTPVFNQPLGAWDTGNVTSMGNMFSSASNFNQNINDWDVSKVENMAGMFSLTPFNEPLDKWDTGSLKYASSMFSWATAFNQNINGWDVSKVETTRYMFSQAYAFNQPLDKWETKNVTDMGGMFDSSVFNQPLNSWDVSNVQQMGSMFASSAFNQPLDEWDVSNVTVMAGMFSNYYNHPLNDWDVSNVTNMNYMFNNNGIFNQPLDKWDVSQVTSMLYMFAGANSFDQDLSGWKTTALIDADRFANSGYPNSKLPPGISRG